MVIKGMGLIAALADNGVIGSDNKLPWERIKGDLPRFKKFTLGHALIIGRKTYKSFGNKPLPDRLNIVLSRQANTSDLGSYDNLLVVRTLEEALREAAAYRADGEFFVGGGGEIYRQTIGRADRLIITHIHQWPLGDTFFPKIDPEIWKVTSFEEYGTHAFADYDRIA